MMIALHKKAQTTRAPRAAMAASSETAATLSLRYGVSEGTVYKWKGRDSFNDASHTAHRLLTTLTPAKEKNVVELRKTLLLPLDVFLAVTREFLCPQATRSGLDRCLRRYGVGNLNGPQAQRTRAATQSLQKLRARFHPYRFQIPAQDTRRDQSALSVRGH